jgi:hypothetical protein
MIDMTFKRFGKSFKFSRSSVGQFANFQMNANAPASDVRDTVHFGTVSFVGPGKTQANFAASVKKLRGSTIRSVLFVHHFPFDATILTGVRTGIIEVRIAAHHNAITRDSHAGGDSIYAVERPHFYSVKSVRQHRSAPLRRSEMQGQYSNLLEFLASRHQIRQGHARDDDGPLVSAPVFLLVSLDCSGPPTTSRQSKTVLSTSLAEVLAHERPLPHPATTVIR